MLRYVAGATLLIATIGTGVGESYAATNQCQRIEASRPLKRSALVVGNAAYHGKIPALANPANDATAVSNALGKLGFTVFLATNATDATITDCLNQMLPTLAQIDVGLFYYSGHGIQIKDENYLVGVNATEATSDLKGFAAVQPIIDEIQKRSKATLVFLDACRNNPFSEDGRPGLSVTTGRDLNRGIGRVADSDQAKVQSRGLMVAYSTSPNSVAVDGTGDLSPFTAAFVKSVATPGYSIQRVMAEVTKGVGEETDWAQTPWIKSSLTADVKLSGDSTMEEAIAASRLFAQQSDRTLARGDREGAMIAALKGIPIAPTAGASETFKEAGQSLLRAFYSTRIKLPTTENIVSVAVSSDLKIAVLRRQQSSGGSLVDRIELWSVEKQMLLGILDEANLKTAFPGTVAISGDGKFAAAVIGKSAKIWDVPAQKVVLELKDDNEYTFSFKFTPDARFLIISSSNLRKGPYIWSTDTKGIIFDTTDRKKYNLPNLINGNAVSEIKLDIDIDKNICAEVGAYNGNADFSKSYDYDILVKTSSQPNFTKINSYNGRNSYGMLCNAKGGFIVDWTWDDKDDNSYLVRTFEVLHPNSPFRDIKMGISLMNIRSIYVSPTSSELALFDHNTFEFYNGSTGTSLLAGNTKGKFAPTLSGLYSLEGTRSNAAMDTSEAEIWPSNLDVFSTVTKALESLPTDLRSEIENNRSNVTLNSAAESSQLP